MVAATTWPESPAAHRVLDLRHGALPRVRGGQGLDSEVATKAASRSSREM